MVRWHQNRGVRPDERSIAGQIKGINKLPIPPRDRFKEFSSGILHSGGDINQTLQDWDERGVIPVLLDAEGEASIRYNIPMI